MTNSGDLITAETVAKLEKLVKIKLKFDENSGKIHSIKITGDFFIHPEEIIETLESGLVGEKLEKDYLRNKISTILNGCQVYGFDEDSLADSIIRCAKGGSF